MFRRKKKEKPEFVEVVTDKEDYYYDDYYNDHYDSELPKRGRSQNSFYAGAKMSKEKASEIGGREMVSAQRKQNEKILEEYEALKLSLEVSEKKLFYYEQTEITNKLLSKQNTELKEKLRELDDEMMALNSKNQEYRDEYQGAEVRATSEKVLASETIEELKRVEVENQNLHEIIQERQDDIIKYQESVTSLKQTKTALEKDIGKNELTIEEMAVKEKELALQIVALKEARKKDQLARKSIGKEEIADAMIEAKQLASEMIRKAEAKERRAEQEYQQMQVELKKLRISLLEKKAKSDELLEQLTSKLLVETK